MADGQVDRLVAGQPSHWPPRHASRQVVVCVMQAGKFSNFNSEKRLAEEMAVISTRQKAGKCPWGQPKHLCREDPVG